MNVESIPDLIRHYSAKSREHGLYNSSETAIQAFNQIIILALSGHIFGISDKALLSWQLCPIGLHTMACSLFSLIYNSIGPP